ncbi:MAG: folate-binding protein YgfZ [Planctomycetaceae bacterium]
MPSADPTAQYAAACNAVALFDVSDRTTIEVRGKDRATFLHNFCTNDIKRLAPGAGCEAFLTNIKGRILGHFVVSADEHVLWLDSDSKTGRFIASHLEKYLITEDVTISDRSSDFAPLLLVGPGAEAWLTTHLGGLTPLPLWGQVRGTLAGADVMIRRVAFTEPPGFEITPAASDASTVRQAIMESGVTPAGTDVLEVLRIEAGFPRYGVDITEDNIAQEAGRTAQAVSFTKGCYLGQEPIARLDALGHTNRELRRLQLAAGPAPAPGTPVRSPTGDAVGVITSAALSPVNGRPVALAMLKSTALSGGTCLTVGETAATIITAGSAGP